MSKNRKIATFVDKMAKKMPLAVARGSINILKICIYDILHGLPIGAEPLLIWQRKQPLAVRQHCRE